MFAPPDQFARGSFRNAINLPLDSIREDFDRLTEDKSYIVCSHDPRVSAVGTLLLVQMGFDAVCLTEPIDQILQSDGSGEWPDKADTVVPLPAANEESAMNESKRPAESSMIEQAREKESELRKQIDSNEPIPRDLYDDTYVGKSLADLIDQMHTRHQELLDEGAGMAERAEGEEVTAIDLETFESEVERTLPPVGDAGPALSLADEGLSEEEASPADELTRLMGELEGRIRAYAQRNTLSQREQVKAQLAERVEKVKRAAVQEVKRQTQAYRSKYKTEHAGREQAMRQQYDKLMALAHRISRQKAELQRSRKELEGKLQATARLQQEIDGLRDTLTQSIGNFDQFDED